MSWLKHLFTKKRKCPNLRCNYNTGKGKCKLPACHYKNR